MSRKVAAMDAELMAAKIYRTLPSLLKAVRDCRVCEEHLPLGARVHASGVPWDDASGERLRAWMGVGRTTFYDASQVAIIPMGYCYPGRGDGGDLPPRRECAELWLDQLLAKLPQVELTLLIGLYVQRHFLGARRQSSLTETLQRWQDYAPDYIPLPHPSSRNTPWFQTHPWFEHDLLPMLRGRVHRLLAG